MAPSKITIHPSSTGRAPAGRDEERALVERCRQGDIVAFEELYRAHAGRLFGLISRMLDNPADAEDMLQDVFLSAHRKLDTFRGDSALGTWLFRMATNLCLDRRRSRAARTDQVTGSLDDEPWLADAGSGRVADRVVSRMDLERAIALLPEGCRAAFLLHDVEGLEHQEVADALGIAEGTSKSQVHKARLRLRALLRK